MSLIKSIIGLVLLGLVVMFIGYKFDLTYTGRVVQDGWNTQFAVTHLPEVQDQYNSHVDNIPNFAKTLLNNERVNVEIEQQDKSIKKLHFIVQDGKIANLSEGEDLNPTLKVWTTEATIDEIAAAKNPVNSLQQAMANEKITYKSLAFTTQLKVGIGKLVVKTLGLWK